MGLGLARCAFDAVERLQRFRDQHPGVLVEHHVTPTWHWSAWVGGREIVRYDLAELLDELAALTHPAPHHPAEPSGSAARPVVIPIGGKRS